MKTISRFLLFAMALGIAPQAAMAQGFTCGGSGAGAYCQYTGKVSRAYVNESNQILMYFEQSIDLALPAAVGITGITKNQAGTYYISNNPDFAEYLYSTLVTALAADKTVVVQFKVAESGYLRMNKIWLYK